ncbi:hypothetical protein O3M35_007659 [Rhynocoris fuscipes]|uniref:Uncharacterized protein n=1 Tax=Rhynocoris fuscipes TaxID=488301 RepID=A0AAW1DDT4_9HEMI
MKISFRYLNKNRRNSPFCVSHKHRYEQIISKFEINRTNSIANRTDQSCKFCVHHNPLFSLLNFFLYYLLMLLNLNLIRFRAP